MDSFLPLVDSGQLRAQLNKIMAQVNVVKADTSLSAKSSEEGGQCIIEFTTFFLACAERHGTTPHAVLGQHVVTNVFVFVLDSIVKPHLTAYCRVAEKHAAHALEGTTGGRRHQQAQQQPDPATATGKRDALEARRRRLRGDIIRPFLQLFQSLHTSLVAEGEPLTLQQGSCGGGGGSSDGAQRAAWERSLDPTTREDTRTRDGGSGAAATAGAAAVGVAHGVALTDTASASTGLTQSSHDVFDEADDDVVSGALAHSLSQAPLLWKNASPLNILCNHILEVLESPWLVAVVGADYGALMLEVLRWAGYARLITPVYLVRLCNCLVGLLERVPFTDGKQSGEQQEDEVNALMVAPHMALHAVSDGRVWVATPSPDDGCVYAQVLMRLYGLSQVTSAFPPSPAGREAAAAATSSSSSGGERGAVGLVRRLMDLVRARHRAPTPDLRLEAYCIAALRLLCSRFPYDHPTVARAAVEVVRLLCNLFFVPHHTPRHDVWRLEVMQLITVVLSYALSGQVGEQLWSDAHGATATVAVADSRSSNMDANDLLTDSQTDVLTLLHQTVYPTMQRIFLQQRHEYSFTSRRELFSFPCSPLQEVFDFGAVVLYLCSVTHPVYAQLNSGKAVHGGKGMSESDRPRKRQREPEGVDDNMKDAEADGLRKGREDTDTGGFRFSHSRTNTARSAGAAAHPVQLLCEALFHEFFQPAAPPSSTETNATATTTASSPCSRRRGGGAAAAPILRIRTAGLRTNAAAVQDVVSDRALFLLHLFAQPCATLRCPSDVTDALVEDVLLPLSAAFGLRMGPLLLAAIQAVVPHCSTTTQFFVFSLLAQRALPARAFGGVSGVPEVALSVREDLLSPSEPMYRVLVTLLQGQLCAGPHSSPLRSREHQKGIDGGGSVRLDDVHVAWETHLQAAVRQIASQLHTHEQAVVQRCEASTHHDAEVILDAANPPLHATAATAAAPSYAPLLSPSLATLMTRFALLVQCVRLQQLTAGISHSDSASVLEVGCGLSFVLHVAAHGVFFGETVPVLRTADTAAHTTARTAAAAVDRDAAVGGGPVRDRSAGDPFQSDRSRHNVRDANFSFASFSTSAGAGHGGTAFLSLFSPADFLAWLDAAEAYAGAALWTHRVQQQLGRSTQLNLDAGNGSRTAASTAQSDGAVHGLRGPLGVGVTMYLDTVRVDFGGGAAGLMHAVPAVLHEAIEGQWMLRMSTQSRRYTAAAFAAAPIHGEAGGAGVKASRAQPPPLMADATRPAIPHPFQEAVATSAQTAVTGLMRRARLLERLHGSTAAPPMQSSGGASASLVLSVQCVQLLHLLLRWKRAGVWSPPEEGRAVSGGVDKDGGTDAAGVEGEDVTSTTAAAAAADAPLAPLPSHLGSATAAAAGQADLHVLASSPNLFDSPATMLDRFSIRGGGRLYFTVLWLCHYLASQLRHRDVLSALPLWAALRTLYKDVGTVLLDPLFASLDPRQAILRFTSAVTNTCLSDGVVPLAKWRPSNPNSREVSRTVGVALNICLDTLRCVASAVRRTGVSAYAAVPLMDVDAVRDVVQTLLAQQALSDAAPPSSAGLTAAAAVTDDLEDALLPSQHPLVAQRYPFLPPLLPVLSALLRLLLAVTSMKSGLPASPPSSSAAAASSDMPSHQIHASAELLDCRTVVRLLQLLFVRYRYQFGPALCTELLCGAIAEAERAGGSLSASPSPQASLRAGASLLYTQCGRLLELWTAQLTDVSRVDMPVCTPLWQCALLQAAFTVLVRCEPAVAEVLGRFSFEFLSEATPYAVRRHAALHVGILFRTFSARRALVLHTLLTKAREGMLSPTPMLCSTSLLALSEAVRAAPELRVDVLYTLLETWATRGFAQRSLVVECMMRLTHWAVEEATAAGVSGGFVSRGGPRLTYAQLCRMHVRPLLFLWLCEYRHPLVALPVLCFGYTTLEAFVVDHIAVLLPLALMLRTESSEGDAASLPAAAAAVGATRARRIGHEGIGASASSGAQGDVFHQLLGIYTEKVLLGSNSEGGGGSVPSSSAEDLEQLAPLCLVLQYVPHVVVQLLVIASSAPVPFFGSDAAELDAHPGDHCGVSPDWARQRGHPQSSGSGRRSGGGGTAGAEQQWCDVAQRCLYWLETLINTCEGEALAQAGAHVWLRHALTAEEATVKDVSPSAGAALLSLPGAANAAAVVVFYLQRLAAWPTRRPAFDVVVSAHVDTVFEEVARLHRTPEEPPLLVYGTAEQLRRVVTWVAERVTAVPVARDAAGSTGAAADLALWQSRCLELLVPPFSARSAAVENGGRAVTPSEMLANAPAHSPRTADRNAHDAMSSYDALARLLLVGGATFLQSLLHAVYRSCTAPTSLEPALRGSKQLSLLISITTRWCSSPLLGNPSALRVVLTYLFYWLHPLAPPAAQHAVCGALLHVWPVAVSSGESSAGATVTDNACKLPKGRSGGLRACASMLSRVLEPQTLTSPDVGSTWRALCRSDAELRQVEWLRRAAAYGRAAGDVAGKQTRRNRMTAAAAAAAQDVVDVDEASVDDDVADEGAMEREGEGREKSVPLLMPPHVRSWSWSTYAQHRDACLAPLKRGGAQRELVTLCALLRHISHQGDGSGDVEDSVRDAVEAAESSDEGAATAAALWDTGRGAACATATTALPPPPPPPFLLDVAAGVDRSRGLLVRCVEVAAVWEGEDAPLLPVTEGNVSTDVTTEGIGAAQMEPEERVAAVVRQSLLRAVALLYSWTVTYAARVPSAVSGDAVAAAASSVAGGGVEGLLDAEGSEEQALACFQLLRSLCMCLLQAGEAALLADTVGAASMDNSSGSRWIGASSDVVVSAEQFVAARLGEAYLQQLGELERLSRAADAQVAEVAVRAARVWALCLQVSAQTPEVDALTKFDGAVMRVMCGAAAASGSSSNGSQTTAAVENLQRQDAVDDATAAAEAPVVDVCAVHGPRLLQRMAWAVRSVQRSPLVTDTFHEASSQASQQPCSPPPPKKHQHVHSAPPATFARVHVTHESVWQPLHAPAPPNERVFLSRFVAALLHTYGMGKRSALWTALLPLLYAEERCAGGAAYTSPAASSPLEGDAGEGSEEMAVPPFLSATNTSSTATATSTSARLLVPVLLHVMCLRESDTQRVVRRTWSELLDRHVVRQAARCPRTARLVLHALHTCHVVLMRSTRQRGLRGAPAAAAAVAEMASCGVAAFPLPSVFGSVPILQDMKECYWLSDIPAQHLAAAAVAIGEPNLALLFAQLSGESLFGPRTGAATLSGEAETTRTAVLLRDGGGAGGTITADPAASHIPFSVLFPYAASEDYKADAAESAVRSGGRARARQNAVRLQTLAFVRRIFSVYDAVQRVMDVDDVSGVAATVRRVQVEEGGDCGDALMTRGDLYFGDRTARDTLQGSVIRRRDAEKIADVSGSEWVDRVRAVEDDEEGQWQECDKRDAWQSALQRAALLLESGLASTAMDVLLSIDERRPHTKSGRPFLSSLSQTSVTVKERGVDLSGIGQRSTVSSHENMSSHPQVVSLEAAAVEGSTRTAAAAIAATPPWTTHHEGRLRSLLSEAAWRCARWAPAASLLSPPTTADEERAAEGEEEEAAVSPAALRRLVEPSPLTSSLSVTGGFYEHLLSAFLALSGRTPLTSLPHLRGAEASLLSSLSATSLTTAVVAAESLHDVRRCAEALGANAAQQSCRRGAALSLRSAEAGSGAATCVLPAWLCVEKEDRRSAAATTADDTVSQMGRSSWRLLDSVRHALSQVYGSREGWYGFLLGATERALAFHDAGQAHRWLKDWERQAKRWSTCEQGNNANVQNEEEEGDSGAVVSASYVLSMSTPQDRIDFTLRKAQVSYALGRSTEALALLQPPLLSPSSPLIAASTTTVAGVPPTAPLEPRVVQQLMLWHSELQLVPASHLVRDVFLARAAAADNTGACSFLLGRLCHTMATDVVTRLTSHEHRQLEKSVERSRKLRAELEAQLQAAMSTARHDGTNSTSGNAAVMGDERLRLLRRRIREIGGEVKRLEEEWAAQRYHYGLYRRSAINAYSRFLQHASTTQTTAPASAAGQKKVARGAPPSAAAAATAPRVRCLPHDAEEDVVHAVFGLVELWLNAAIKEQDANEVLEHVLDRAVERMPTSVLLPLASQLTAQLGSPVDAQRLSYLVGRLAQDYPLHLVWSLLALRHGHTFAKSREVNTIHAVDEVKVKAAQALLDDLSNAAEPTRGRATAASALVPRQVRHAQLLSSAYLELAFERSSGAVLPERRYTIKDDFLLLKRARHLVISPPTALSFALPTSADALPHVVRYRPYFTTPGGVNVPKVLRCELSDGQVVRQLLKSGDDLRQDALIEQIFTTANQLFARQSATRPLRIRTFTIVPLAPAAGILQWVEHTLPFGEYVTGRYSGRGDDSPGAHERYFPGEPNTRECRMQLQEAPPSSKTAVLLKLFESYTPALHYFFLETFFSAQAFVERQQTFTRSVAASSMVGYIVGLGDRHINNILLHEKTAEVVHIDLGFAFEQSRLIPIPELVPFRMTRNIIDGLGVRGTEGSLRPCAEAALGLLRDKRDLLFTLLSAVTHDPLARWVIGAAQINADAPPAAVEGSESGAWQASSRQPPAPRARASNADAARTLARIDAKLRGYDGGDTLSVATQVRKLMAEAQRVELLAQMFPGWSQWV